MRSIFAEGTACPSIEYRARSLSSVVVYRSRKTLCATATPKNRVIWLFQPRQCAVLAWGQRGLGFELPRLDFRAQS